MYRKDPYSLRQRGTLLLCISFFAPQGEKRYTTGNPSSAVAIRAYSVIGACPCRPLFSSAARSERWVSSDGASRDWLSQPVLISSPPVPVGVGSNWLISFSTRADRLGNTAVSSTIARAWIEITSCGSPRRHA